MWHLEIFRWTAGHLVNLKRPAAGHLDTAFKFTKWPEKISRGSFFGGSLNFRESMKNPRKLDLTKISWHTVSDLQPTVGSRDVLLPGGEGRGRLGALCNVIFCRFQCLPCLNHLFPCFLPSRQFLCTCPMAFPPLSTEVPTSVRRRVSGQYQTFFLVFNSPRSTSYMA